MNQPARDYPSVAFVSGKGGVGKTTLALNFAQLVSLSKTNVLLVDLDFHNLGSTSLFSRDELVTQRTNASAAAWLESDVTDGHDAPPSRLTPNLHFLPAIHSTQQPHEVKNAGTLSLHHRLSLLFDHMHKNYSIELFVLDCHGGIEDLSVAAAILCEHALVVTEPDPVTFGGTLRLVDQYYNAHSTTYAGMRNPRLEFVLNRITTKYSWQSLDRIYRMLLMHGLGQYTASKRIISYMPSETYINDSFVDYPFLVDIAGKETFAKKLELLIYELFPDRREQWLSPRAHRLLRRSGYRRRTYRRVTSWEQRTTQSVVSAYAWRSLVVLLLVVVYYAWTAGEADVPVVSDIYWSTVIFEVSAGALMLGLIVYEGVFACWLWVYYRNRLRIQKATNRVFARTDSPPRTLKTLKWRLLFYSITSLLVALFGGVIALLVAIVARAIE